MAAEGAIESSTPIPGSFQGSRTQGPISWFRGKAARNNYIWLVVSIRPPTLHRLLGVLVPPGSVPGLSQKPLWGFSSNPRPGLPPLTQLSAAFFEAKRLCTKVLVRVILAAGAMSTRAAGYYMLRESAVSTPLKNMSSSVGIMTFPYIMGK